MNLEEYKGVYVFAQQVDNEISSIAYELLGKAKELAKDLGISVKEVEKRGESLHEVNPMMGHRGVRLHVSFPLIAETVGPRSRPIAVAPTSMISGLNSLITDESACA